MATKSKATVIKKDVKTSPEAVPTASGSMSSVKRATKVSEAVALKKPKLTPAIKVHVIQNSAKRVTESQGERLLNGVMARARDTAMKRKEAATKEHLSKIKAAVSEGVRRRTELVRDW